MKSPARVFTCLVLIFLSTYQVSAQVLDVNGDSKVGPEEAVALSQDWKGQAIGGVGDGGFVRDFPVAPGVTIEAGQTVAFIDGAVQPGTGRIPGIQLIDRQPFSAFAEEEAEVVGLNPSQFVVAFKADSGPSDVGYLRVGTIEGDTLSFGPQIAFSSPTLNSFALCRLAADRVAIVYDNLQGYVRFARIEGDTIVKEERVPFSSGSVNYLDVAPINANRCLIAFTDGSDGDKGKVASFGRNLLNMLEVGTPEVFSNTKTNRVSVERVTVPSDNGPSLPTPDFAVAYTVLSGQLVFDSHLRVGEVLGFPIPSTISLGAQSALPGVNPAFVRLANLSGGGTISNRLAVGMVDFGSITKIFPNAGGILLEAEISEAGITFGNSAVLPEPSFFSTGLAALSEDQVLVSYLEISDVTDFNNPPPDFAPVILARPAVLSSEGAVFGSALIAGTSPEALTSAARLSAHRAIILSTASFPDAGYATLVDLEPRFRIVGIARTAASGGGTVSVTVPGLSTSHTGLTPGLFYFASEEGTLTEFATEVPIGLAVSSSEIVLNGGVLGN